jgi:bifunctional DNA-binding transcriptional regulator/antitoxin component of YhaV-PrlF toxin-antitoxin module
MATATEVAAAKIVARKYVRVRERNQITLPNEIISGTPIEIGDFLEVALTENGVIMMAPTRLITSINSADARQQEALADNDIKDKNYDTFNNSDDLIKEIEKRPGKRKVAARAAVAVAGAGK